MQGISGIDGKLVDQVVNLHLVSWMGRVLSMPNRYLLQRETFARARVGWKDGKRGQTKTQYEPMKLWTVGLKDVD